MPDTANVWQRSPANSRRLLSHWQAENFLDSVSDILNFLKAHPDWPTPRLNAEYVSAFISFGNHVHEHLTVIK